MVKNEQIDLKEMLVGLPVVSRVLTGSIACAILACYVPLILIAMTGVWVNNLTMWMLNGIWIGILFVVSLVGYRTSRVWPTATVAAILMSAYVSYGMLFAARVEDWRFWWPMWVFGPLGILLNARLFSSYMKMARVSSLKTDSSPSLTKESR
jgi:hypothetical protein